MTSDPLHIVRSVAVGLPEVSTQLLGRKSELARAERLIEGGYVEILGAPGVGKTRLAVELARVEAERWEEVFWVSLQPADETVRLAAYVARSLGINARTMRHSGLIEALRDRGHRMLIVLDNAEHVAAEVRRLVRAFAELEHLAVIVTSRERIEPGEAVELRGLDSDAGVALMDAFRVGQTSVRERSDLVAFVEHVGGLPLALRLAAARLDILTPQQLLEVRGDGALADAVRSSWERLSELEQRTMAALAAFRDGAEPPVLAVVAGQEEELTIEALAELRRRSLVEARDLNNRRRFSLLPTMREFVETETSIDGFRSAHSTHFAMWGISVAEAGRSMQDDTLVRCLAAERSNLVVAAAWAISNDDVETSAAALVGLAMAAEISGFADDVYVTGKLVWARRDEVADPKFFEAYGHMLADTDRTSLAAEVFSYLDKRAEGGYDEVIALRGLARCFYRLGDLDEAVRFAERAVEAAKAIGDLYELAVSRRTWAAISSISHAPERAVDTLVETARMFREFGARRDEAQCEYLLAWHWLAQESPEAMAVAAQRAVQAASQLGDLRLALESRWLLGAAKFELGALDDARDLLLSVQEDSRRFGIPESVRSAAESLVNVYLERGEVVEAREMLRLHGRYAAESTEPMSRFWHQEMLGEMLAHEGDLSGAANAMDAALSKPPDHWNASLLVGAYCYRAIVAWALGDLCVAETNLALAQRLSLEAQAPLPPILCSLTSSARAFVAEDPEIAGAALEPLISFCSGADGWVRRSSQCRIQAALIEAHLGRWTSLYQSVLADPKLWLISADGTWFRTPMGDWVSLRPRQRLSAMLRCLLEHEVAEIDVIAREVWAGELMTPSSALNRIRATISMLRSEGLGEVISHGESGYELDRARGRVFG